MTVRNRKAPGTMKYIGSVEYQLSEEEIIEPQDGVPGGTPRPRKDRPAS